MCVGMCADMCEGMAVGVSAGRFATVLCAITVVSLLHQCCITVQRIAPVKMTDVPTKSTRVITYNNS